MQEPLGSATEWTTVHRARSGKPSTTEATPVQPTPGAVSGNPASHPANGVDAHVRGKGAERLPQAKPEEDELLRQAHRSKPDRYGNLMCLVCRKAFKQYSALAQHLKGKHHGINDPSAKVLGLQASQAAGGDAASAGTAGGSASKSSPSVTVADFFAQVAPRVSQGDKKKLAALITAPPALRRMVASSGSFLPGPAPASSGADRTASSADRPARTGPPVSAPAPTPMSAWGDEGHHQAPASMGGRGDTRAAAATGTGADASGHGGAMPTRLGGGAGYPPAAPAWVGARPQGQTAPLSWAQATVASVASPRSAGVGGATSPARAGAVAPAAVSATGDKAAGPSAAFGRAALAAGLSLQSPDLFPALGLLSVTHGSSRTSFGHKPASLLGVRSGDAFAGLSTSIVKRSAGGKGHLLAAGVRGRPLLDSALSGGRHRSTALLLQQLRQARLVVNPNQASSTDLVVRRGKERADGKKKKRSTLKKIILRERAARAAAATAATSTVVAGGGSSSQAVHSGGDLDTQGAGDAVSASPAVCLDMGGEDTAPAVQAGAVQRAVSGEAASDTATNEVAVHAPGLNGSGHVGGKEAGHWDGGGSCRDGCGGQQEGGEQHREAGEEGGRWVGTGGDGAQPGNIVDLTPVGAALGMPPRAGGSPDPARAPVKRFQLSAAAPPFQAGKRADPANPTAELTRGNLAASNGVQEAAAVCPPAGTGSRGPGKSPAGPGGGKAARKGDGSAHAGVAAAAQAATPRQHSQAAEWAGAECPAAMEERCAAPRSPPLPLNPWESHEGKTLAEGGRGSSANTSTKRGPPHGRAGAYPDGAALDGSAPRSTGLHHGDKSRGHEASLPKPGGNASRTAVGASSAVTSGADPAIVSGSPWSWAKAVALGSRPALPVAAAGASTQDLVAQGGAASGAVEGEARRGLTAAETGREAQDDTEEGGGGPPCDDGCGDNGARRKKKTRRKAKSKTAAVEGAGTDAQPTAERPDGAGEAGGDDDGAAASGGKAGTVATFCGGGAHIRYADQVLSPALNAVSFQLLSTLLIFQEKMKQRDPMKMAWMRTWARSSTARGPTASRWCSPSRDSRWARWWARWCA
eukprot:jgi/Mesvir1/23983/Mv10743-RA.2